MLLNIKWKFHSYPTIFMTENKDVWQKPFSFENRNYGYRKLTLKLHQGYPKYRINGKWVWIKQLNNDAYLVEETIEINQLPDKLKPFNIK